MTDEKTEITCKDCEPTFLAFLEEMAAHNAETIAELKPRVACPSCGKIHEYRLQDTSKADRSAAS